MSEEAWYVVTIGKTIFTELDEETKRYELYAFPFKYHAQFYLNSFTKDGNNPYTLSLYSLKKLWNYWLPFESDTDVVIAKADGGGKIISRDFLFPSVNCAIH